jgi:hypothetical protein
LEQLGRIEAIPIHEDISIAAGSAGSSSRTVLGNSTSSFGPDRRGRDRCCPTTRRSHAQH